MARAVVGVLALTIAGVAGTSCDLIVVGAGVGGAYAAMRAAKAGKKVCIFERAARPGGRIHSLRDHGPRGDLVVEAGAYRFAPHPIVEKVAGFVYKIDTPLTAATVRELGLPNMPYNPNASDWDHGLYKIVDAEGENAGYLTLVETLLKVAVDNDAELRYRARVMSVHAEPCCHVVLEGGERIDGGAIVLNMPQAPVIELLRQSEGAVSKIFPRPLYIPVTGPILKLYIHYDDAWWRNDLGLVSGQFYNTAPAPNVSQWAGNVPSEKPAPLQGAYHDGHVRCDLPDGRCRGYLQIYYGSDSTHEPGGIQGAVMFYSNFADAMSNDSVTEVGPEEPHHVELLNLVHDALLELHRPALKAAGVLEKVTAMRPSSAVLSIWSQGVAGIEGGCHQAKPLPGGQPRNLSSFSKSAMKPFPEWPIWVANEAFGTAGCWAEGSLAMAEMAMREYLGPDADTSLGGQRGAPSDGPFSSWPPEELSEDLLGPEMCDGRLPTDPALMPGVAQLFGRSRREVADDSESTLVV